MGQDDPFPVGVVARAYGSPKDRAPDAAKQGGLHRAIA